MSLHLMRRTSSGAQFKSDIISVTELVLWKTISHTYQLHGHTLEKANSAKYLGITIQNNLKWDKHINTIRMQIKSHHCKISPHINQNRLH
jgi:hypothetical protein